MGLFDVHAHLTHPRFAGDLAEVLARARAVGVTSVVSNGLDPADNLAVLELARREDLVRPAVGLYPVQAVILEMRAAGIDYPRQGAEYTPEEGLSSVTEGVGEALAVGEIGLDGHWVPERFWGRQEAVFRELVQVALDHDKPIIIHTRRREQRALDILREMHATRVNWHCFGGKVKLARQIAELGHFFSIPANARRNESFTSMLKTLPRDRILLETDCPYLAPERQMRNAPEWVATTLAYAAELWQLPLSDVTARLEQNYHELFREWP